MRTDSQTTQIATVYVHTQTGDNAEHAQILSLEIIQLMCVPLKWLALSDVVTTLLVSTITRALPMVTYPLKVLSVMVV